MKRPQQQSMAARREEGLAAPITSGIGFNMLRKMGAQQFTLMCAHRHAHGCGSIAAGYADIGTATQTLRRS